MLTAALKANAAGASLAEEPAAEDAPHSDRPGAIPLPHELVLFVTGILFVLVLFALYFAAALIVPYR